MCKIVGLDMAVADPGVLFKFGGSMKRPLYRQYIYEELRPGVILLKPVPSAGPEAVRFTAETKRIAINLWGPGASLNSVYTGGAGPLIFQHPDADVNRHRARRVTRIWRNKKTRTLEEGSER